MKILNIKLLLLLLLSIGLFQNAKAQTAYGLSDIIYDNVTKKVTTYSGTYLDYYARIHYTPAVCGEMYQEFTSLGWDCRTGYNSTYELPSGEVVPGSLLGLRTTNISPPDTRYDILSDHYIVAYYYTDVIIFDDDSDIPQVTQQWYDPLALNKQGGQNPGWYGYHGQSDYSNAQFYEYQYFYLGTTGKAVIANPTTCEGFTESGAPPDCNAPLTAIIKNELTGDTDISGTTKKAFLGAKVQLNAVVSGGNGQSILFRWLKNADLIGHCDDKASCSFFVDDKKNYNIKLIVVQSGGGDSIQRNFTLKGDLPEFEAVADPTYPIVGGYSAIQRVPRVTTGNDNCANPTQRLMLGCTDANPHTTPPRPLTANTKNISGIYLRANLVKPSDLISKGDESGVEIIQFAKPRATRTGVSNGKEFMDVRKYVNNHGSWKRDFKGTSVSNPPYVFSRSFQNGSNVVLDYPDSPSNPLINRTSPTDPLPNAPLIEYTADQNFRTYITYYNILSGFENNPPALRYALKYVDWKWNARAKKFSNTWKLYGGNHFPKEIISIESQDIVFDKASSGEVATTGNFDDTKLWERQSFSTSPITTTTNRNIAVWRKSNGVWWVVKPDGTTQATQWGVDYDIPVPADYDGDGLADFAVFRPDDPATSQDECAGGCVWYILKSSDSNWQTAYFGSKDDKPTPADFDGDGTSDVSVFRPSTNTWHIMRSSDNSYYNVVFGSSADTPLPSDYDGDGIDDIAMWSPSTAMWSVKNSSDQTTTTQQWGTYADIPVIGDYDGDGKTDFANWQSNGDWLILLSADGQIKTENFGLFSTDIPVPGNYDGDDKTDIAVWRPNASQASEWYIKRSSDNQVEVRFWGLAGDVPIPAAYNR